MAENKTKPTAASVSAFVAAIGDAAKRADAQVIVTLMQAATGEKPVLWGPSIIGFGSHRYRTDAGREGDMPIVAYSPRAAAHGLYIMPGFAKSEALLAKLGKHRTGKSCLYVNKLADIDMSVLKTLIHASVSHKRAKSGGPSKKPDAGGKAAKP